MEEDISKLDFSTRDKILDNYYPQVKKIASNIYWKIPPVVALDDLIQAGMVGLIEAADKFDINRQISFDCYVKIKIRGHIIDELRHNDWAPRSLYKKSREVSRARHDLENRYGRGPKGCEIAEELGIDIEEYYKIIQDIFSLNIYGFEDLGILDDNLSMAGLSAQDEPLLRLLQYDLMKHLFKKIKLLPIREQKILMLRYFKEIKLKEIGQMLDISESRVCQISSSAVSNLKNKIES